MPQALLVRVTDGDGAAVSHIRVGWSVSAGAGNLFYYAPDGRLYPAESGPGVFTDGEGLAGVFFRPTRLGTNKVIAAINPFTLPATMAIEGGPVEFTAHAIGVRIDNGNWGYFLGPDGSEGVTIPVGTEVEWFSYSRWMAHIASTSTPPGGSPFNFMLNEGESFLFTPEVPGMWIWTWHYISPSGETVPGDTGWLKVEQP